MSLLNRKRVSTENKYLYLKKKPTTTKKKPPQKMIIFQKTHVTNSVCKTFIEEAINVYEWRAS
jgi:hypothetical protein